MTLFKWVNIVFCATQKQRQRLVDACLYAIKIFNKGEESQEGTDAFNLLTSSKVELIGIVPDINYVRVASKCPDDLEVIWNHRFSVPTLLYRVKGTPFLLLANPNVEYNKSKLLENPENSHLLESHRLAGIIG